MERLSVGTVLAQLRTSAELSQQEVASRMNMSVNTIRNWENDVTSISVQQFVRYCDAIGRHPLQVGIMLLHPSISEKMTKDDDLDSALTALLPGLSTIEKQDLLFILSAVHGGDRTAFLQEAVADLQCPLSARVMLAQMVSTAYKMSCSVGRIAFQNSIQPDIDILDKATEQGFIAACDGKKGYTT